MTLKDTSVLNYVFHLSLIKISLVVIKDLTLTKGTKMQSDDLNNSFKQRVPKRSVRNFVQEQMLTPHPAETVDLTQNHS